MCILHVHDSAVIRLCISRAVVRAETVYYTSRMPSPATGACALYIFPWQMCDRGPCPVAKIRYVTSSWVDPQVSHVTGKLARMVTSLMHHNTSRRDVRPRVVRCTEAFRLQIDFAVRISNYQSMLQILNCYAVLFHV